MDELIFYSIPGAISTLVFAFIWKGDITQDRLELFSLIAGTPLIGYLSHQIFRIVFENISGGYSCSSHKVVTYICETLSKGIVLTPLTREQAFLIWDITVFSNSKFNGFREHNARSWHYLIGHWVSLMVSIIWLIFLLFSLKLSTIVSSMFSLVTSIFSGKIIFICFWKSHDLIVGCLSFFLLLLIFIFFLRSHYVYKSINDHEITLIITNKEEFEITLQKFQQDNFPFEKTVDNKKVFDIFNRFLYPRRKKMNISIRSSQIRRK